MIGKYSCRLTFETALKLHGGPSLVLAHSLGNNVFRYFLEWLKLEIPPKQYIKWLDEHIHAYFAVGKISLHLNYFLLGTVVSMIIYAHCLALFFWGGVGAGSPFLGATQSIKATLSGETSGLPVSEVFFFFLHLYFVPFLLLLFAEYHC